MVALIADDSQALSLLAAGARGVLPRDAPISRIAAALGSNKAAILRNHGLLTAGRTVCEAFVTMHWLEKACQAQVMAMACNTELNHPAPETVKVTNDRYKPGQRRKITELEWPALLRMLDRRDATFRE